MDMSRLQEELRETDMMNKIKIKFRLLDTEREYEQVENINLDRIRVQRKYMKSETDTLQVICKVELTMEKKRLSIISPLAINNCSNHEIELVVDPEGKAPMKCPLHPDKQVSIPLDLTHCFLDLTLQGHAQKMQNRFVISKILKVPHEECFPLEVDGKHLLLQINTLARRC